MKTSGYAAQSAGAPLAPYAFARRELRPNDIAMEIYCGICHTDLHQARNDWGWSIYPIVPGHEIVGRVIEVGSQVTRYRKEVIACRRNQPSIPPGSVPAWTMVWMKPQMSAAPSSAPQSEALHSVRPMRAACQATQRRLRKEA